MTKKAEIRRVVIFYILAFTITTLWHFLFNNILSGDKFGAYNGNVNSLHSLAGFSMLGPAAAAFITRAVTKEGWKDNYLKFNIKGNVKYYILSFAVVIASTLATALLVPLMTEYEYDFTNDYLDNAGVVLYTFPMTVFMQISLFFGEEYGWRGYLFPKLKKLAGVSGAVIISGILWGFWHLDMLLLGHNFGLDAPFYPVSNILLMMVFCTVTTPIHAFFSEKTKSVWPAAIVHLSIDAYTGLTLLFTKLPDDIGEGEFTIMDIYWPEHIPLIVVSAICWVLLIKDNKKTDE